MPDKDKKKFLIGGALLLSILLYLFVPGFQTFIKQAFGLLSRGDVKALKTYLLSFGLWAPIISGALMVLQSIIAPLPAFVITFTNGLLFGVWWGTLLSWSSAMVGAAICFFIAQTFGRPATEKLVSRRSLEIADGFFARYGKHAVLIARLIPIISFDVVSYGAGLTSIGFWPFWLATGIGQLPATIVYSYLGQSLTGTVKILFWVFVVVITLLVLSSALKLNLNRGKTDERKQVFS